MPAGNRRVGRSRTPARHAGTSRGRLRATTPSVVPPLSTASAAGDGRNAGCPCAGPASTAYHAYAAMTTTEESSGASAGPAKR